jgi:hypothetical protein
MVSSEEKRESHEKAGSETERVSPHFSPIGYINARKAAI